MKEARIHTGTWTAEEDATLRQNYLTHTSSDIARSMGRTTGSVANRCWQLGLNSKAAPHWSDDEVERLRAYYERAAGHPVDLVAIAKEFGRCKTNVCRKARELGLTDHRRPGVEVRKDAPKYPDKASLYAAQSAQRKQWIAEHGHPRGALGMRHTAAAKALMSEALRKYRQHMTKEQLAAISAKARKTKMERYGTAGNVTQGRSGYSRCRGGKREDLGGVYFRSGWESNYARYLNVLLDQGQIRAWEYEARMFTFHGETRGASSYLPDFRVEENDGRIVYYEVKGWETSKDRTKWARMQKHYPEVEVRVVGEREYRELERTVAAFIKEWEYEKADRR